MADDCSQLWHLTDSQLLAYFNHAYPQTLPWKLVTLHPAMHSALISTLQKQRPLPQLFLSKHAQKTVTGAFGKCSLPILWESIHTLQHSPTHQASFSPSICNMPTMQTHCTWQSPYLILASGRLHMDHWQGDCQRGPHGSLLNCLWPTMQQNC